MLMTLSALSFLFALAMAARAKSAAQNQNRKGLVSAIAAGLLLAVAGCGFFWLGSKYPNAIPMATAHRVY